MKRPFSVFLLTVSLLFISFGAFYGGAGMIIAPDGSLIGIDMSWIENSPFSNFLIPGIILLLFLNIFPLITVSGLFIKISNSRMNVLNLYPNRTWGWTYLLYTGIISLIWIIVQQFLTDFFILQPIIASAGLIIIVICLIPQVQEYYSIKNNFKNKYIKT